jgi:Spy/CpxP family protein refolding chaperone
MVRHLAWALGAVLLFGSAVKASADCLQQPGGRDSRDGRGGSPSQNRPKFWQDPKLRQELGITDQQSAAIEQIFQTSIPSLREARKELEKLEAILSTTIKENTADLITVSQQVDKVEAARSAYNKARTVMLYRINLVLNPDQRAKVKAMHERDEEQRRRDDDRRRQIKNAR